MLVNKPIDLNLLQLELTAAAVPVNTLGLSGLKPETGLEQELFTFDGQGQRFELPPEAVPVVDAHDASKPQRTAAFEAAEDAERMRVVNERARTDPAFAALADLALGKDR